MPAQPDTVTGLVLTPGDRASGYVFTDPGASLAGRVYEDVDGSGSPTAADAPVPGATVRLFDGPTLVRTTVSDGSGNYVFRDLPANTAYTIIETTPAGYLDGPDTPGTPPAGSSNGVDSITAVPVARGAALTGYAFGEVKAVSLSGTVTLVDGTGLAGVTVGLKGLDDRGADVDLTTTTVAGGAYSFTGLRPGTYAVTETQPAAYADSSTRAGDKGGTVPTGTPNTVTGIQLLSGDVATGYAFVEQAGSLAGSVYEDLDGNGVRNGTEPGITGVTVVLTAPGGATTTATTGAGGGYLFGNLPKGVYSLTERQPAGYADGADALGTPAATRSGTDVLGAIDLGAGQAGTGYTFGELRTTSLSGVVQVRPGLPLGGVTVRLLGSTDGGAPVDLTTTSSTVDGSFSFPGLTPGTYELRETQPVGYAPGSATVAQGQSGTVTTSERITAITVAPGVAATGYVFTDPAGSLAGRVFDDLDSDGVSQGTEPGIDQVTVQLVRTGTTTVVATTTTAADGSYLFADVVGGTYTVREVQPTGFLDGKDAAGTSGGTVTEPDTITGVVLDPAVPATGYTFGEVRSGTVRGTVTLTTGTPLPGVTVQLFGRTDRGVDVGPISTTTAADGTYAFTGVAPGTYNVTEVQPTAYGNGTASAGNSGGTAGTNATTGLLLRSGGTASGYDFTDVPGSLAGAVYDDTNRNGVRDQGETGVGGVEVVLTLPGGATRTVTTATDGTGGYVFRDLASGSYALTETQPFGYADGAETVGSTGGTLQAPDTIAAITLDPAEPATGYLFGDIRSTAVSGTVQSAPGAPVSGVTVTLTPATGPVLTAVTDADGVFAFPVVPPGTYTLTESQPTGYGAGTVTVPAGQPGTPSQPDTVTSLVLTPGTIATGYVFTDPLGSLSGRAFEDTNADGVSQAGEPGLVGVTVTLFRGTTRVTSTTTGAGGSYTFTGLVAGDYTVVEDQPAGYLDGQDAPASASTEPDRLAVTLVAGTAVDGLTFGEVRAGSVAGSVVLTDGTGLRGVTVALSGTDDRNAPVRLTTTTAADGSYAFTGLRPGLYDVLETQPTGYADVSASAGTPAGTPGTNQVTGVRLVSGTDGTGYVFTERAGSLSGTVYQDANKDGVRQPLTEPAYTAGPVRLVVTSPTGATRTVTTAADGTYSVDGLVAGTNYTVQVFPPAGTSASSLAVLQRNVVAGQPTTGVDFGLRPESAPDAVDDARTTRVDTAVTLDVTTNDTDPDVGDPKNVTVTVQPQNGAVSCTLAGSCTYTPAPGFTGTDTFTYRLDDGQGGSDTAVVTITVLPANNPPVANADSATTTGGAPVDVNVLANDTDADNDVLFVGVGRTPANGTVSCTSAGLCTYTPNAGYVGPDSFTYQVSDGQGGTDTATVTIDVQAGPAVNRAPVAADDAVTVEAAASATVDVLRNDADPDGDPLAVTVVTQPTKGTVTCSAGVCTYTAAPNASGTDTFTYRITDPAGLSDTATVTVTITAPVAVNRAPVARDDAATVGTGAQVVVPVLGNDTDPDNDPLTVTGNSQGTRGTVSCTTTACTYTPTGPAGGTDTFTYTVSDGRGGSSTATVTVTVSATPPANNPPVAANDSATTPQDTAVLVPVLRNDTDADGDPLTATLLSAPLNGAVVCGTGGCTYTPTAGYSGPDSFTYTVSDGKGGTDTARVDLTVTPANVGPVANPDSATTPAGTPVVVPVVANDTDADGGTLTASVGTQPANGVVTCTGTSCRYVPDSGFVGTDTFTYTVSDGQGGTATGTVTVTVTSGPAANRAPIANPDSGTTPQGQAVVVPVTANDTDADGDALTASAPTTPANGTATCTATSCTYTPNAGFVGTDTFSYTVSDGQATSTALVTITVTAVNQPVTAVDDVYTVPAGTATVLTVVGNDTDPDGDVLTASVRTQPANGVVTCSGGACTYTPNPGYSGPDSFTYTVSDGRGSTDVGAVSLTVTAAPVNQPPVVTGESATTTVDTAVTVDVRPGDSDPEGGALTYGVGSQPAHGTVTCSTAGSCVYTPDSGYAGPDSFTYTVTDPQGASSTATVTVSVTRPTAANLPPVVTGETATTTVGTPVDVTVSAGDSDPEGGQLTYVAGPKPANGTVTCTTAGVCTYTPDAGFAGTDTFTYVVSDPQGASATGTVTVTVTRPTTANQPPVVTGETATTTQATPVTVDVRPGDSDPDGGTLTYVAGPKPAHGTVTCTGTGSCTYTPDPAYTGTDTFTYVVSDGQGGSTTGTVTVTITNAPPVARDDQFTVAAGSTTQLPVLGNDSDAGGGPVQVVRNTAPATGTVDCTAGTSCTYTAPAGLTAPVTVTFDYTVRDAGGLEDTATVTLTVSPVAANQPPAFTAEPTNTAQTVPVGGTLTPVVAGDPEGAPLTYTVDPTTLPPGVTGIDPATGAFTGTPTTPGTYPVVVTVTDPAGGTDTTTVVVTVTNRTPVARDDADTTQVDTPVVVQVLANDTDGDAGQTLTVVNVSTPSSGSVSCTPAGACTVTPAAGSTAPVVFTYTVSDGFGGTATATVTVTVTAAPVSPSPTTPAPSPTTPAPSPTTPAPSPTTPAPSPTTPAPSPTTPAPSPTTPAPSPTTPAPSPTTPANRAPVAGDDRATTPAGTAVQIPVLGNDTDPDGDPLTVTVASLPAHGTVVCTASGCTYTPTAGYSGTDTFTYTVDDGRGGTDTATVTVLVTAPAAANRPPTARDDAATTPAGTPVRIPVLTNDTDPDGDPLVPTVATRPAHGTVVCTATGCTYTPAAGYSGTDTFTYTVDDGQGGTDTATVTVTVQQGPPPGGTGDGAGDADGDGIPDNLDPTPNGPGTTPGVGNGPGTGTGTGTGTGRTPGGSLARTGSDLGLLGGGGLALVALGGLLLLVVRPSRRRLTA